MYAFGVDIGGTTNKIGLFTQEGSLIYKWEIPTRREHKGINILPDLAKSIQQVIEQRGLTTDQIIGVGLGIPGSVDTFGTVYQAPNLDWDEFHVPSVMESLIHLPVKVLNDANAAAFGEMWSGGAQGISNMVFVTLGTGVGGGIIVNGAIVTGAKGAGGEIGHLRICDNETLVCGCGNTGCLEQYTSATGITRIAKEYLEGSNRPSILRRDNVELSAKAVFDAVKEGDALANDVALTFGDYLGKGLAAIAAVVNPQRFVIGGGVSKAGEILLKYIRPAFMRYAYPASRDTDFVLATLGNDAGIYGVAGLFFQI
ncbi:MAG: ROK family glucokinase [Clostridium sp.]|jgi:glucokinase|nr:ROK family glucokinase [Clostridium sp.]